MYSRTQRAIGDFGSWDSLLEKMAASEPFSVGFMPKALREKYMMKGINPICALNEYCQVSGRQLHFILNRSESPCVIKYVCEIDNYRIGEGTGATRRLAKDNAGEDAMKHLWRWYMEERREDGEEDNDSMEAAAATADAQAYNGVPMNVVSRVYEYYQAIQKPFRIDSNYKVCNKGYISIVFIDNRIAFEIYGNSIQHSRQKAAEKILKCFIPATPDYYNEAKSGISHHMTTEGTNNRLSEGQQRSSVSSSPSATIDEEDATLGSPGEVTVSSDDAILCKVKMANSSLGDTSQSITQKSSANSTCSSARQTADGTILRQPFAANLARSLTKARDGSHSAGRSSDERIGLGRSLYVAMKNYGSSSNDFVSPSIPQLRQSSALHSNPNDCTISQSRVIDVHREQIVSDMLRAFEDPEIINISIKIQFRNEAAEDADGVSRDAYTSFWESFCAAHTEGNEECVPVLFTDYNCHEWEALGRILLKGYRDQTVFPLHLSVAFIVAVILGEECVDVATLLESYNHYLSETERAILDKAVRQEMNKDESQDFIDFLCENGVRSIPKSVAEVMNLVGNIAHKKIIQEPKYILDSMASSAREGLKLLLPLIKDIHEVYQHRTPCVKTVLNMLVFPDTMNKQQDTCSNYLKKYIRNLSKETLRKFLRFVTAADMICVHDIKVQFNNQSGLQRRPVAQICGPVLELSSSYASFQELRAEFDSILRSGWMTIDIA